MPKTLKEKAINKRIKMYGLDWRKIERQKQRKEKRIGKEELEKYLEEHLGATQGEIAEYFGMSASTITRRMQEYGIRWKQRNAVIKKQTQRISTGKRQEERVVQMLVQTSATPEQLEEFLKKKGIQVPVRKMVEEYKENLAKKGKTVEAEKMAQILSKRKQKEDKEIE